MTAWSETGTSSCSMHSEHYFVTMKRTAIGIGLSAVQVGTDGTLVTIHNPEGILRPDNIFPDVRIVHQTSKVTVLRLVL